MPLSPTRARERGPGKCLLPLWAACGREEVRIFLALLRVTFSLILTYSQCHLCAHTLSSYLGNKSSVLLRGSVTPTTQATLYSPSKQSVFPLPFCLGVAGSGARSWLQPLVPSLPPQSSSSPSPTSYPEDDPLSLNKALLQPHTSPGFPPCEIAPRAPVSSTSPTFHMGFSDSAPILGLGAEGGFGWLFAGDSQKASSQGFSCYRPRTWWLREQGPGPVKAGLAGVWLTRCCATRLCRPSGRQPRRVPGPTAPSPEAGEAHTSVSLPRSPSLPGSPSIVTTAMTALCLAPALPAGPGDLAGPAGGSLCLDGSLSAL